jgi:hypothetical protein
MNYRYFLNSSVLALGMVSLGVCASLSHSKDEASVQQVKRVAVVAFTAITPASASIGVSLSGGGIGATAGGSIIPKTDPMIEQMYVDLGKAFSHNLNWDVMSERSMLENSTYKADYDKTMKGWQNKMGPGRGQNQFNVADVMDSDGPRILDVSGRDELIQALGVDAIVVARVQVSLTGTTVAGIGSRHPQTSVAFWIYKKGQEKAIWFEGGIKGEETEESVGKTAFIDESLLNQLALKSAQSAYTKIGASSVQ